MKEQLSLLQSATSAPPRHLPRWSEQTPEHRTAPKQPLIPRQPQRPSQSTAEQTSPAEPAAPVEARVEERVEERIEAEPKEVFPQDTALATRQPENQTAGESTTRDARQALLKHPNLWRAGELNQHRSPGLRTGYDLLDRHLPGQGWPSSGLVELLLPCAGVGELRLLLPALAELSRRQQRWVGWVNPPFIPYAPALQAAGIDSLKAMVNLGHAVLWPRDPQVRFENWLRSPTIYERQLNNRQKRDLLATFMATMPNPAFLAL